MNKDNKEMKHFRKWAEDKNPLLATGALFIAGFPETYFALSESIRKGKRIEGDIPLPRLKTWLKLYHNPKRIGKALIDAFRKINDDTAKEATIIKSLLEGATQLQKMNGEQFKAEWEKISPPDWKKIIEDGQRTIEEFKELAINDFASKANEDERKKFLNDIPTPERIFFFRVMAPCFSLYGTYPVDLLRQAQNGDDDALEKLIRLDKSIIFEPKISEIIHQAQAMKKQERMSKIKKAFRSSLKVKMNMKTIKCHLGGLISYLSMAMKQKIAADDIKNLYDALALDMGIVKGDRDLEKMEYDAFEKAIRRARYMWHIILLPDK